MPLVQTRGAASAQGFGEFAQVTAVNYIEEVFSCFLYTGTGSSQTITNNIDLSTKGGLTWIKGRSGATGHRLTDTARGVTKSLESNSTAAEATESTGLTAFGTTGFTIGADADYNTNAATYVSWTFRKQPKFFDVVTYTATGSVTNIAHSLGSVPGCIIIKNMDDVDGWVVYHRSIGATKSLSLNTTAAEASNGASLFNSTTPTSTVFTIGTGGSVNFSGNNYVAYLFAHDAGGFGLSGTDNVISCGSYVETTGPNLVNLGYEPQFLLIKKASDISDWWIIDNMRGMTASGQDALLRANTSGAEISAAGNWYPTATGFGNDEASGDGSTWIYIAIRRGPMKVPTSGTSVFGLSARTGTGANATVTGGQTDDAVLVKNRGSAVASLFSSRLTGTGYLVTSSKAAEVAAGVTILQANPWDVMDGVKVGTTSTITNASSNTFINYLIKRAPSFMDVVCYTGGITSNPSHNLGVTPEMYIVKCRSSGTSDRGWFVYHSGYNTANNYILIDSASGLASLAGVWSSGPTATTFGVENGYAVNDSGQTYVTYLFATCAGVSKVFSYTGNGSSQTINCGFTAGSRWVMIKRTDSTGDWYVWDSARGIVAGNDPHLSLNSTAAEVTTDDSVDTNNTGFIVNQVSATNVNVSSATYIGIAIA